MPQAFQGFPPPTSNTTYTPNQFFDVLLPYYSRGASRLVAYILRKTLGWCDAEGNPQETEILVTYQDLVEHAGISRGAIAEAIQEAIAARFIRCVRRGNAKGPETSAVSALYELTWDDRDLYVVDPAKFHGFYAGEGHRTYVPNLFFDQTVRTEPLSVVKVVGSIIRHTIGWQTKLGFRRQQVQLSFATLQKKTHLSSRHLNEALQQALAHNYILRVEQGFFDINAGRLSKATTYGVKWLDSDLFQLIGSKRKAAESFKESPDRFKKESGIGSKRKAADRFKKESIKIKQRNKTIEIKQQQQPAFGVLPVAAEFLQTINRLTQEGFDEQTASYLATTYSQDQILNQCNWLRKRNPSKNRLGMLRTAIEQNWPEPLEENICAQTSSNPSLGFVFASHFYAGYHNNPGVPVAYPSANDIVQADRFVKQLLTVWPAEDEIASWGRQFGQEAREHQRFNEKFIPSFTLALRVYGDKFFKRHQARREETIRQGRQRLEAEHREQFEAQWMDYLREKEAQFKEEQAKEYAEFLEERKSRRAELVEGRFQFNREERLKRFDSGQSRLEAFQVFFPDEVLDFWDWDEKINPLGLRVQTIV